MKLKSKIFKFILTLLLIIIIGVNSVGTYYLAVTDNFISKFDEKVIEYDYYYLLSLKSSNIKTVDDLNNKVIGVTENNQEKVIDFIDFSVESKVNNNITNLIILQINSKSNTNSTVFTIFKFLISNIK